MTFVFLICSYDYLFYRPIKPYLICQVKPHHHITTTDVLFLCLHHHHTSVNRAGIVVLTIRYIISYFWHLWFIQQTQAAFLYPNAFCCVIMRIYCMCWLQWTICPKSTLGMQDILGKNPYSIPKIIIYLKSLSFCNIFWI